MSDYCRSLDALDKAVKLRLSAAADVSAEAAPGCGCCGPETQFRPVAKAGSLRVLGITLAEAAKIKKSLFAELLFTVIVVYALMFTVFISSIFGSANLLKIAG